VKEFVLPYVGSESIPVQPLPEDRTEGGNVWGSKETGGQMSPRRKRSVMERKDRGTCVLYENICWGLDGWGCVEEGVLPLGIRFCTETHSHESLSLPNKIRKRGP
jgi:hypothetical protein